ncbi:ABC transporter substrate-binding protein [Mesorhizobium sp. BAC0120]|uniref:ABC transporter substrate-binding protein n=1 Tax=Mesorhizobium sp. BAC0120 TaxID=3090670 RepID=UPI00298C9F9B|nr:ABC transporter substrate-binding protein [Mesorhizobium sp. BAC0120]MDW6024202.1 ABC transporter substrate-binding protein [Mesorhizobium sp. BAC0120]
MKTGNSYFSRRAILSAGAGLVAFATLGGQVLAQEGVQITPVGEKVKGTAKPGPYRIGFSNGFSGNSWRAMAIAALQAEAKKTPDIADFIIVDGQGDINKQVNDIETLANQQVDAILCIANSGSAVAPALKNATDEGIVTVPFNLPVDGEGWSTYVGTDPVKKGGALGKWLNDALGGKGKIVALGGLPGNSYTAAGWDGAQKAFGPGIEVLAFKDAFWEEDKAKVVMADLIAAYPEIDGVWCDGGQNATGAMKALLAAGRPLVPVTGDDYNGLLKLYKAQKPSQPKFDIGLMSEPTWQGIFALRAAVSLLKGEEVAKQQILSPALITSANYEKYIRPDLPDGVFVDTSLTDDELRAIFK